jgi:hypothetical protein
VHRAFHRAAAIVGACPLILPALIGPLITSGGFLGIYGASRRLRDSTIIASRQKKTEVIPKSMPTIG